MFAVRMTIHSLTAKPSVTVARTVCTFWSISVRCSYLHCIISSEIRKKYNTKQDQSAALSHRQEFMLLIALRGIQKFLDKIIFVGSCILVSDICRILDL